MEEEEMTHSQNEGISSDQQVAESTETTVRCEEWPVEVTLDEVINDTRYYGPVKVYEGGRVDFGDMCTEGRAVWNGYGAALISTLLTGAALHLSGRFDDKVAQCHYTGWWVLKEAYLVETHDGYLCLATLAKEWRDEYYFREDGEFNMYRNSDGYRDSFWAPNSYWEDLYYCEHCECYVDSETYHGDDWCEHCWAEEHRRYVIESYGESHDHNANPVLFGEYKDREHFAGFGFELEVDTCDEPEENNDDVAANLCSECGLEENEMRFAHDGSLSYGFECISEPHTVKDFWSKTDKWRKMLKYLSSHGYSSHNVGTCGLHIHVSRNMLGNTVSEQSSAIAKIYTFFDQNWNDMAKVSRRSNFEYCEKNNMSDSAKYNRKAKTDYEKWRVDASRRSQNHYVALNNGNTNTFEYRLGRGTLNAWSFFSWIDLILTITKNARRITVEKVETNDLISWLGGITESTAKYIYKRGAFRSQMLTLYPNIEWEGDLTDNSN